MRRRCPLGMKVRERVVRIDSIIGPAVLRAMGAPQVMPSATRLCAFYQSAQIICAVSSALRAASCRRMEI